MVDSTFNDQELGNSTQRDIKKLRSIKDCACVQRTIVCTFVLVVAGLMALITASFLIVKKNVPSYGDTAYSNLSAGCSNYTYLTCREELRLIQSFLLGVESNENATLAIASEVDQENNKNTAMLIQYSLNYVKGTRECKSTILSFMCLYLFPLCDADGTIHTPSAEDCHEITGTCKEEFEAMVDLPGIKGQLNLPDCQSLLNSSTIFSVGINASLWKNDPSVSQSSTASHINCSERFFLTNGTCLPRCDKWSQYSDHATTAIEVAELATSIAVIVLGSMILAVSCFDCGRMYAFPSVLILHFIVFLMLDAATTAISFIDRATLLCSSLSLLDAHKKPTAFCSAIQSLHIYFTLEISIWWFSHVATLFWQIAFPFHARMSKVNGQNKYIYGGILITSLIVPAISLVAVFESGGYEISKFDLSHCVQKNADVAFYAVLLPINMPTFFGAPLMILIIVLLIKHRRSKQDPTNTIITADRKILLALFYFLLFSAVSNTFNSVGAKSDGQFASNVYKYFQCESMGEGLCDAEKAAYEDISLTFSLTDILYRVLFGTIPFVTLVILIPAAKVKRLLSKNGFSKGKS